MWQKFASMAIKACNRQLSAFAVFFRLSLSSPDPVHPRVTAHLLQEGLLCIRELFSTSQLGAKAVLCAFSLMRGANFQCCRKPNACKLSSYTCKWRKMQDNGWRFVTLVRRIKAKQHVNKAVVPWFLKITLRTSSPRNIIFDHNNSRRTQELEILTDKAFPALWS